MNLKAVPNAKKPRSQIDLSWDPPSDDGGEKIVGYEIQQFFENDQGGEWYPLGNTADDDQVTVVTEDDNMITDDADLDPGDSRKYRVRAINGPDEVDASDGATVDEADEDVVGSRSKEWARIDGTTQDAANPGRVTGLTAVNAANTTINLYWYDPADNGGWAVNGYLIQARRDNKKFLPVPKDDDLTTTATTGVNLGVGDAIDNYNFYYGVQQAGDVYQAQFDSIVAVDHDGDADTDAIQVRWHFRVYALTTDDGENEATDADGLADDEIRRSQSASNVASDTAAARAIAYDHDDDDDTPALTLDPLAEPTITATTGANAKKPQIDVGLTVNTALTTPDPDVEQIAYRIDYSKNQGRSWKLLEEDTRFTGFGATKPYADNKGLGFDESRRYRVFAVGKDPYEDVGLHSNTPEGTTAASTKPGAPTGVMASAPSLTSIMASWTAPEDNGGQSVVKYHYQYVKDDGDTVPDSDDWEQLGTDAPVGATTDDAMTMGTFKVASLDAETLYHFRVAAVNKAADGTTDRPAIGATGEDAPSWSDADSFDTSEAAKPGAVEGLTSEAATDTSGDVTGVNLLWNKPSGEIKIDNYDVEVQDEEGDWANPAGGEDLSPNRTSYTDSDEPEADEMRVYRVRATNEVGDGPWTMVYYPRDPDMHTHVAASGTIPTQTVTVGMTETVNAAMYFSNNAGATYAAMSDMTDYATVMVDANSGMVTITGVAEGTATITVTATSGAVEAEQEFMVTVESAITELTAPTSVEATVSREDGDPGNPADVTVTWTDGMNADRHVVFLFDANWEVAPKHIAGNQTDMETTFNDVPSGTYTAVVVAVEDGASGIVDYEFDADPVTVQ